MFNWLKKTSIISFVILVLLVFSVNAALGEGREFGRKPYISVTYHDMMTKKTNRDAWNAALVKQSEFEKPYASENYDSMQYYFPSFPGFSFDVYAFDFADGFDPYEPYEPWHIIFMCDGDPCFCKNQTKCFGMNCSYPIVDVVPTSGCGGLSFKIGNGQICVTADSDPEWGCTVDIVMAAKVPYTGDIRSLWYRRFLVVNGKHEGIRISECDSKECCTADPSMAYDYDTSAATIARDASVTVAITGNNKPFTWSVSGTGFSLDNAETEGLTNTLNADNTACGSATITVTGCDDVVATGYVRCTTGQWSDAAHGCILSGAADTKVGGTGDTIVMTKTQGKYKQEHTVGLSVGGDGNCSDIDCSVHCNAPGCENCTECLTWLCADRAAWGGTKRIDCGPWCCHGHWDPDCNQGYHYCQCNKVLRYCEWQCQ